MTDVSSEYDYVKTLQVGDKIWGPDLDESYREGWYTVLSVSADKDGAYKLVISENPDSASYDSKRLR